MPNCRIDHLVVTAPSLETGAEFVRRALGVRPQPGGEHPRMGTHNLLLRLGEALYLEVIAINPQAPAPGRPRWFGLDAQPPDAPPRLGAWVARTTSIRATFAASSESLGEIEPMSRGALEWLIGIPADGLPPLDGVAPIPIEWRCPRHPAATLEDLGLSLVELELFHPDPPCIATLLASLAFEGPVAVSPRPDHPRLVARIRRPFGETIELSG